MVSFLVERFSRIFFKRSLIMIPFDGRDLEPVTVGVVDNPTGGDPDEDSILR